MQKVTSKHTIIKSLKISDKEKILKAVREKRLLMDRGTNIKLTVDFLSETIQTGRQQCNIYKVLLKKNQTCQLKLNQ